LSNIILYNWITLFNVLLLSSGIFHLLMQLLNSQDLICEFQINICLSFFSSYMLACLRSVWVCIAPRSFVTLSPSGAASKRASHSSESTPHLSFPPICAITIAASPFSFVIGLTSHEKATYHPPAVICRLTKPFWQDVTRDVNRRQWTATRKKQRKEAGRKKKTKRTHESRMGDGKREGTWVWIRSGSSVPLIRDGGRSRPPFVHPLRFAPSSCTSGNLVASGENVSREDNEAGEGGTIRDLLSG